MKSAQEINADAEIATDQQIKAALLDVHTSMPGIIINFDPLTKTASVQPAIQRVFLTPEGEEQPENLPPCEDVPVYFPSGGGCSLTFPVKAGDYCLLMFSERCIDNWFINGGTAPPDDYRQHDLSDAFALVGFWPQGKGSEIWMGGVELKNDQASVRISSTEIKHQVGSHEMTLGNGILKTNCIVECTDLKTISIPSVNAHKHVGGTMNGITGVPTT
ncbi:Gp138 family membrane-puncturing spike protein [Acinetobacter higginsii]|uniref:Gp138 family membrane-puncturing spike protein n=1 Tax=Acinetobacter higginsii TaxID=70347 RepID=UPI001F4A6B4F|nr:Gp138 family membrane-puncturing spike protein [Acinetobacter higginsii]MCH7305633.1 hypothetical protein [Acinetobacter higginsii]MCI3877559.1 hypothetical protein [Acinetobacter higginsii]